MDRCKSAQNKYNKNYKKVTAPLHIHAQTQTHRQTQTEIHTHTHTEIHTHKDTHIHRHTHKILSRRF